MGIPLNKAMRWMGLACPLVVMAVGGGLTWGCHHDPDESGSDTASAADEIGDADPNGETEGVTDCDGGRLDPNTGVCWQRPRAGGTYRWQDAIDYCRELSLGDHDDWHLPTRQEFIDMLGGCDSAVLTGSFGYCNTCANSTACSSLFGADTSWYWSSTSEGSGRAWFADFGIGFVSGSDDTETHVRCVRSAP